MKINFNKKVLIGILVIFAVLIVSFLIWRFQKVEIVTDRMEYENGGILKLKIKNLFKNLLLNEICFSSCYPYYLERKNEDWRSYNYRDCLDSEIVEKCIGLDKTRAFEIDLPIVKEGLHRISVPVCENCEVGKDFQETKRFYSNEFEIR